jgi:hypothetical protein
LSGFWQSKGFIKRAEPKGSDLRKEYGSETDKMIRHLQRRNQERFDQMNGILRSEELLAAGFNKDDVDFYLSGIRRELKELFIGEKNLEEQERLDEARARLEEPIKYE